MNPTFDCKVAVSTDVLFQKVGVEAVLLDLASESYFGLDEVGARIWQLLLKNSSLSAIYAVLLEEYDVGPAQVERDLLELIGELVDAGLLTIGAE